MFEKISSRLGSNLLALDVLYVKKGFKKVSRLSFRGTKEEAMEFFFGLDLELEVGTLRLKKHVDESRGYSDKGALTKEEGDLIVYVARRKADARAARTAEEQMDHKRLGELLSYPSCCINSFINNVKEAPESFDFTRNTFGNTPGVLHDWHTNNCLRCFDICLLSHFPCSFKCEESVALAKRNLSFINDISFDLASYFKMALKGLVIYSEGVGVYSIKSLKNEYGELKYDKKDVVYSKRNEFSELLIRNSSVFLVGRNKAIIGKAIIDDKRTHFGLFL